jgi:hypothetical protein
MKPCLARTFVFPFTTRSRKPSRKSRSSILISLDCWSAFFSCSSLLDGRLFLPDVVGDSCLRSRCCLTRRIDPTLLSSFVMSPGISTCCAAVSSAARTVCCWSRCLLLFRSSCCFRLRFLLELNCGPFFGLGLDGGLFRPPLPFGWWFEVELVLVYSLQ